MSSTRPVRIAQFAWAALFATSCGTGAGDSNAVSARDTEATAAQAHEATLYGGWTVTAINGTAPLRSGTADPTRPSLFFAPARYEGYTGCNSFGGTGLLVGKRWFGEPPIATEQGCGDLTAQEQVIIGIASGGPAIALQGSTEATLTGAAGSLRLRREAEPEREALEPAPMLLAGTRWEVGGIDGHPVGVLSRRERARLIFEADRWTLDAGCSLLSGPWRQAGGAVAMRIASKQPSGCGPTLKAEDDSIRAMIAAGPRYVVGFNRELVMGGGDHWLTGRFDRSREREAADGLRGEWRVDAVDGAAPKAMPRPPSLIFGKAGYAVWDGCNHTEGVSLVVAGRLFTRGSGVSTMALCPTDPLRARIRGIVASNPQFARTSSDGMALVSRAGTLRMTRLSGRDFGTLKQLGLRAPRTISLLGPRAELMLLGGGRFAVALDCGRVEGNWRGGQPARFSPDPFERTAPNCPGGPGSAAFRLSRFFTGDVSAVTGPNRDIVLLVNEGESIAGQVAR